MATAGPRNEQHCAISSRTSLACRGTITHTGLETPQRTSFGAWAACAPRTSCARRRRTTTRCVRRPLPPHTRANTIHFVPPPTPASITHAQVYVLGALLVARYSGMPYPDFVRARILAPLNMSASTFVPSAAWRSGRLTHTWAANGRRVPFWETDEHVALIAGAGGLISSAEDSVKWLATWLNAGVDPASGARIFSEDVYTALSTAQYVSYGTPIPGHGAGIVGFGLGWYRWAYGDVEVCCGGSLFSAHYLTWHGL